MYEGKDDAQREAADGRPGPLAIQVNGALREVPRGSTVAAVIAALQREPRAVAVELNGAIVPRERYRHVGLHDGDRLEIVQFVQGG